MSRIDLPAPADRPAIELMPFRRDSKAKREWSRWIERHGGLLRRCGLPETVFESEDRWWDFLMHGFLDHHDDPLGFSVDDVKPEHVGVLLSFIEEQLALEPSCSSQAVLHLRDRVDEA